MRVGRLYSLIVLVVYSISIIPSFLFHNHHHSHNHIEGHCQSVKESKEDHIDCTHSSHYGEVIEDCFLCSNYAVYEHFSDVNITEYNDNLFVDKIFPFYQRLSLSDCINNHNKSPPTLIVLYS